MQLNDLLAAKDIDLKSVLVMRHRPSEPEVRKVLPWLAAERSDTYNAYQQTQSPRVEKAMMKAAYVASFIGSEPGKALFVGLYQRRGWKPLTYDQLLKVPAYREMKSFGSTGDSRDSILLFDLELTDFYAHWKGRLIVLWPGLERSWWRWANRNEMLIDAILQDSDSMRRCLNGTNSR